TRFWSVSIPEDARLSTPVQPCPFATLARVRAVAHVLPHPVGEIRREPAHEAASVCWMPRHPCIEFRVTPGGGTDRCQRQRTDRRLPRRGGELLSRPGTRGRCRARPTCFGRRPAGGVLHRP